MRGSGRTRWWLACFLLVQLKSFYVKVCGGEGGGSRGCAPRVDTLREMRTLYSHSLPTAGILQDSLLRATECKVRAHWL